MPTPPEPPADKTFNELGWSSRMFRWEFLVVALVIAAFIAAGVYTTVRHGPRPPGGLEAIKPPNQAAQQAS